MKNIFLIVVLVVLSHWYYSVNANWYGSHSVSYGGSTTTPCNEDWQWVAWTCVQISGAPVVWWNLSSCPAGPLAVSPSWNMSCFFWDQEIPTVTDNCPAWWVTSLPAIVTLSPSDTWWSWVGTTKRCEWGGCTPSTSWTTITKNVDYNGTIRYQTCDIALNCSAIKSFVLRIDGTPPTVTDNYAFDGVWTNWATKTITLNPQDLWSWIKETKWCEWASCNPSTWNLWTVIIVSANYKNTIRYQTWDNAWSPSAIWTVVVLLDNTPPQASDVTINYPSGTNFLATTNQNFSVSVTDWWWAPINSIQATFERWDTPNIQWWILSSASSPLSINVSIRAVDNDRQANWSRSYLLRITNICDEAGNCLSTPIDRTYNVYSNSLNLWVKDVTTNQLTSPSNIADGSQKNLTINLKDIYGNVIIPATWISRTIDFNFNVNNSLYLDQYTRTWFSAISASTPNSPWVFNVFSLGNPVTNSFNLQNSPDWNYNFIFKAYAPTYQTTTADPSWKFAINSISSDINGSLGQNIWVSVVGANIDSQFKPLYNTTFSWDLKTYWFIEGAIQKSQISVSKEISSSTWINREIYLEYGSWARQTVPNLSMLYSQNWNPTNLTKEGHQVSISWLAPAFESTFSTILYNLRTKLMQTWGSILDLNKTYLSSHIKYTLDWNDVVYNSDIIGKWNYWDNLITKNNTYQTWLKVLWISSSKNSSEIITNQFPSDVRVLGNIYKASLKKDIISNVYSVIKNIIPINWSQKIQDLSDFSSSSNDWVTLINDSVLYFWWLNWSEVVLWNWPETVSGKKTIIVEGGNLYIKHNIKYNDENNDILWIIVLKDANWNGGNLYIDPSVTRIDATIFTERSLISYNWTILDWDTEASVLKDQLYIFGTVFSENTIGGARMIPPKCPYYTSSALCTVINAQTYDLNYLRRYFIYDDNNNWIIDDQDIAANGWVNYANTFKTTIYLYARYPVVIEYNSLLSLSPPPLFTK